MENINQIDIAYLCSFFASSIGPWGQKKSGSPLDHSKSTSRFSLHTLQEDDPFLEIRLPERMVEVSIKLRLRDQYTEKALPLRLEYASGGRGWKPLGRVEAADDALEFYIADMVDRIRVTREGYGYLFLAGVDVNVPRGEFDRVVDKFGADEELVFVATPRYGLGGVLAVHASALGALQKLGRRKIVIDRSAPGLIDYPPEFSYEKEASEFVRENVSPAVAAQLFGEGKLKSERPFSQWIETGEGYDQHRPVVFVSRNNVGAFRNPGETATEVSQRLYQRIIPSFAVWKQVAEIEAEMGLTASAYRASLGLHIRHGNGELYHSPANHTWGVKPPTRAAILEAVDAAIKESDITQVVLCSDSPAVADMLRNERPHLSIIFASRNVQATGAGCNHLDSLFDVERERKQVLRKDDDFTTFAEMLLLSRCAKLCGGKSFFYEAVIGFSDVKPGDVSWVDNHDRYAVTEAEARPLTWVEHPFASKLLSVVRRDIGFVDGLFLTERGQEKTWTLGYFDTLLAEGDETAVLAAVESDDFRQKLLELRCY